MVQNWAIKVENLRKDYPGATAVRDLDFGVLEGRVHGFLGPNGAGKSTTLRMICGLLRPSSGRALVHGLDPVSSPNAVKALVGLLPESTPLYREMAVGDFLAFAARLRQVPEGQIAGAVEKVLGQTGLLEVRHRLIGNLSKGFRQRVGIAQSLVHDPKVVILDEPTAGLDPQSVVEIRALIKSLRGHKTVIFSSHILSEVEEICDTISIIDKGELKANGELQDIKRAFQGQGLVKVETDRALSGAEQAQLRSLPFVQSLEAQTTTLKLHPKGGEDVRSEVVKALVGLGVGVLSIEYELPQLEDVFISLTKAPR